MARRATIFKNFRKKSKAPLVFLNGGYTFSNLYKDKPGKEVASAMISAFERLNYDQGMLTPDERNLLAEHGLRAPQTWTQLDKAPKTRVLTKGGVRLGLVMLADTRGLQNAKNTATTLNADVRVLVSSLGIQAEKALLNAPDNPFHLILGGGPGTGVNGKMSDNAQCLWLRSYPKGKAVQLIDILALPGDVSDGGGWENKVNIRWQTKPLKDTIADDPEMATLLKDLPEEP